MPSTEVTICDNGRLQTPLTSVPAKRVVPEMARDKTRLFFKPVFTQVVPLFVKRNTPSQVPAKKPACPAGRFMPAPPLVDAMARADTEVFVNPVLTQVAPLLVERKTPLSEVPAIRFDPPVPLGEATRQVTELFGPIAVQLVPLLVDKKTPPYDPAKRFVSETARVLIY